MYGPWCTVIRYACSGVRTECYDLVRRRGGGKIKPQTKETSGKEREKKRTIDVLERVLRLKFTVRTIIRPTKRLHFFLTGRKI